MGRDAQGSHGIGEVEQLYFPQSHLDRFEKTGKLLEVPKNYILAHAGEVPDCCYYIRRGRIVSYEYTASGEEHVFSVNEAGNMILVPSMIITHELTLSFRTALPSSLVQIDRGALQRIIREDPEITMDFMYMLSARLMSTIEQFRERGSYSVSWRVCQMLLSMAGRCGISQDGGILLGEKISQQEMANRLQANRVTVARTIRELKELGLVEYSGGFFRIRSIDGLREHMAGLEIMTG